MKITIKNTLLSALAMLGGLLLISDASGLNALLNVKDGLKSVYDDRVVPLRDLKVISDSYAVSIVDASHKIRNGNTGWAEAVASVQNANVQISKNWQAYLATSLVPEEVRLVSEIKPLLQSADQAVRQLQGILERQDRTALDRFVREDLYARIDPVSTKLGEFDRPSGSRRGRGIRDGARRSRNRYDAHFSADGHWNASCHWRHPGGAAQGHHAGKQADRGHDPACG
jgi:methyl-accepting chemotaxis protein